jgi:chromosome partitioning protein
MNVITVASRGVGTGKTTLTARLAAIAQVQGNRCLIIDADPQGSLAWCNSLNDDGVPPIVTAERGITRLLAMARGNGYEWVFLDTSSTMWVTAQEAIRAATLVMIPALAGFRELAAVRETVNLASAHKKPYAVVFNAAPPKRDGKEALMVRESRAFLDKYGIPVWSGQISDRAELALADAACAGDADAPSSAAVEITRLWTAIERSVEVVNAAHASVEARGAQDKAA